MNVLAESIASPAVGNQPSWAHVVKGGVSVVPPPPALPPPVQANPELFRNPYKASREILIAAKAALKAVVAAEVREPVVKEVALPPAFAVEVNQVVDVATGATVVLLLQVLLRKYLLLMMIMRMLLCR